MAGDHNARLGTRLGPRVALLMSQAMVYTHARLLHIKHALAMKIFHAISDEISEEVDITLGPFLKALHDQIPEDHPVYPSIHFMHTVSGQLKALAGTGLQISGLLGSIATVMNNELAPFVYTYVKKNPHMLPDADVFGQMLAAGLIDNGTFIDAFAQLGYNETWATNMGILAKSWPQASDGLEMIRRGLITNDQFAQWMGFNGVPENIVAYYLKMVNNPVSVADAALAVLRGNIDASTAQDIATENGFTPASFQILVDNTGEPPGLQELLEGYRRGFIDEATLKKGILQSRYRDEWIPLLEQLRYEPMSTADAIAAVVQDQLDATTAKEYAQQNGLEPDAFDVLVNTAGEPLSRTEMEELFNRGLVTEDQVNQALRESRVKNKYVALAFQLHVKMLPIFTLVSALKTGGFTEAQAVEIIMSQGYSKNDAVALVSSSSGDKLKTYKEKVVSAIQALYENDLVSSAVAQQTTQSMGFSADEAALITQASDLRREQHVLQTSVGVIRSKFLGRHITSGEASGYLDAIGVESTQRDNLLHLWEIEQQAYTRTLTEAQVIKGFKDSLITEDDATARLLAMGYNETDAKLLIAGA